MRTITRNPESCPAIPVYSTNEGRLAHPSAATCQSFLRQPKPFDASARGEPLRTTRRSGLGNDAHPVEQRKVGREQSLTFCKGGRLRRGHQMTNFGHLR